MAGKLQGLGLNRSLMRAGERVCVAISGGADSVALLVAVVESNSADPRNPSPLGVVVSAAHVHHGLRGEEADGDEAFVVELCERLGVPLRIFRVDTVARKAAEGEGLEEAARELRYQALRGLMAESAVDVVATAHTLEDQAETVVIKMLRGAWTEGLGGISPVVQEEVTGREPAKGRIIRPMLGVRRAEVEAFLRARGISWREDSSNADRSLTRNRVRHELMPTLRSFNPGVDGLLARTAEIARDEEAYWQGEVARVVPQMLLPGKPVRGGGRAVGTGVDEAAWAIEIERLRAMPAALRRRVIRAAIQTLEIRLSSEETAKVLALGGLGDFSGVTGRIGSRLELQGGLRVERSARELRFWRERNFSANSGVRG
jgi:tRNA(Ile)-lysidine synthase